MEVNFRQAKKNKIKNTSYCCDVKLSENNNLSFY